MATCNERKVGLSKEVLLRFLKEIPKHVLQEVCKEVEGRKAEQEKTSGQAVPGNLLLLFVVAVILVASSLIPLDRPLPLDYEYSWVVFTLISMLSLQYVEFANRLKELLHHQKIEKAKKAAFLLQWTGLFFIINISALAIRIIWLSFSAEKLGALEEFIKPEEGQDISESLKILEGPFLILDRLIIASFSLGCILRIAVFFQSYWKDLAKRWPWKCK